MKLHEGCGAADAQWRGRADCDDVAFFDEALFEKALFGEVGEAVDFFDVGDVAGSDTPGKRHSTAGGRFVGKSGGGEERARKGGEGRRGTAIGGKPRGGPMYITVSVRH